mmetsp:Transcript_15491/g.60577  ORF Transcript_15491/g.60577 Transcript_15491/m.60577 type:complete len:222 (-) Transcript_15491:26-691(-)
MRVVWCYARPHGNRQGLWWRRDACWCVRGNPGGVGGIHREPVRPHDDLRWKPSCNGCRHCDYVRDPLGEAHERCQAAWRPDDFQPSSPQGRLPGYHRGRSRPWSHDWHRVHQQHLRLRVQQGPLRPWRPRRRHPCQRQGHPRGASAHHHSCGGRPRRQQDARHSGAAHAGQGRRGRIHRASGQALSPGSCSPARCAPSRRRIHFLELPLPTAHLSNVRTVA